ncbi:hypothetical protein I79_013130 [Cricetulus griseus]|uniref:Uncharacterized protein n=1 Tax=Cricetulus griseus TaxID=10029 RepID=G3HQM5_CRIGR|nr:hypothetical protein I79_013130 [Cricetulus griseus]
MTLNSRSACLASMYTRYTCKAKYTFKKFRQGLFSPGTGYVLLALNSCLKCTTLLS